MSILTIALLVGIVEIVLLVNVMNARASIANMTEYKHYVETKGKATYSREVRDIVKSCKQISYCIYLLYLSGLFMFIDYIPYFERVTFIYIATIASGISVSWFHTQREIPLFQYTLNVLRFEWFCLTDNFNDILRFMKIK